MLCPDYTKLLIARLLRSTKSDLGLCRIAQKVYDPTLSISLHLFLSICSRLSETVASVHDVAVNTFSTSDIVLSVMKEMKELVRDWEVRLPQTICIDEFKGSSGSWNPSRLLTTAEINQESYWKSRARQKLQRLDRIFQLSPDIRCMYDALKNFHAIFREPQFSIQRLLLSKWVSQYLSSEIQELRRAVRSIRRFRRGILNVWKYGKSNASCEGLNRRIKEIKRNACGMHDA